MLSLSEIRRLSSALRDVFAFQASVRDREPLAAHIRNAQIPPALSESLAAYLLQSGDLPYKASSVHHAFDGGDLRGELPDRGTVSIEVKATGATGRQRVAKKDLEAGLLVWIHFGSFFADPRERRISVVLMFGPGKYLHKPGEIPFESFLQLCLRAEARDIAVGDVDLEALLERVQETTKEADA